MSLILKEIIFAESFYFVKCFLNFLHFLHFPAFLFEGKFDEMSLFCIFSGIFFFVKFNYSPFTEAAFVFSISLERGKRYVFSFYLFTFVSSALSRDFFFFFPFLPSFLFFIGFRWKSKFLRVTSNFIEITFIQRKLLLFLPAIREFL